MGFNGRNPNGQRKSFFFRIKQSIASVPVRYEQMKEEHRVAHLQKMAQETKQLEAEEKKIRAEIQVQKADEDARAQVMKRKAELEQLKKLKFEHSTVGRALASVERGAERVGSGLKTGAQKAGAGIYTAAAFVQPYAKKALGVGQRAEGGRRRRRKVSRTISFAPSGTVVRARVKRAVKKKRRGGGSSGFGDIVGSLG